MPPSLRATARPLRVDPAHHPCGQRDRIRDGLPSTVLRFLFAVIIYAHDGIKKAARWVSRLSFSCVRFRKVPVSVSGHGPLFIRGSVCVRPYRAGCLEDYRQRIFAEDGSINGSLTRRNGEKDDAVVCALVGGGWLRQQ
jgi:hypothetical protein